MSRLYIAPYRVAGTEYVRKAAGQAEPDFAAYLDAVRRQEWLYDTGDDPSFFCFRHLVAEGGSLSWGICRPDVRNRLEPDDVVAFFGFREKEWGIEYYFSAYATVWRKLCPTDIWRDPGPAVYQHYLNLLVRPEGDGFRWHESNPNKQEWHRDWLWRMAQRSGARGRDYDEIHGAGVFYSGLTDSKGRRVQIAENYILFKPQEPLTHILAEPCLVALYERAWGTRAERWFQGDPAVDAIRELTIGLSCRGLRTKNKWRPHRHIAIELDTGDWRQKARGTFLKHAQLRPLSSTG
jgi:hypothetical protein